MNELLRRTRRPVALVVLAWLACAGQARAEVHGGIEIGAKGVKATVLDVTAGADGYKVKELLAGTKNTTLTAGLAASGRFNADAVRDTAGAVAAFAARMRQEYRVPPERLYVVGSSGLFSALAGKEDAIAANRDLLAAAVRDACGLAIQFIDVCREVELSVEGTIPARDAETAALFDIGGGNTKGGYREGKAIVSAGIPLGTVTFTDFVKKRAGQVGFAGTAEALRDEVLVPALRKALKGKPGLTERQRIYLSGGSCWALATLARPGDRGPYVALTAEDVAAYRKTVRDARGAFPTPDLSGIADPDLRAAARKEIDKVKAAFTPEQMLAGAELLQALADELGFARGKKVYFARNAQVAWILAYVVEKAGAGR
jgi:exopolyphosphatase/pppGpp-phosphohydrolase